MTSTLYRAGSIVLVLALSGLVVALGLQNRSLEDRIGEVIRQSSTPREGMYIPEIRITTLAGDSLRIARGADGSRQVLAVFTTTCPYCRASIPRWKELEERLGEEGGARLIGIAVDSVHRAEAYVREHGITYPVTVLNHPRYFQFLRVQAVPEMLVLDHEGRVTFTRIGVMETAAAVDSVLEAVRRPPSTPAESTTPRSQAAP